MDKERVIEIFEKFLNDTKDMSPDEIKRMLMIYAMADIVLREKNIVDKEQIYECYLNAIWLFEYFMRGVEDGR